MPSPYVPWLKRLIGKQVTIHTSNAITKSEETYSGPIEFLDNDLLIIRHKVFRSEEKFFIIPVNEVDEVSCSPSVLTIKSKVKITEKKNARLGK